jgi:hypothetical protein
MEILDALQYMRLDELKRFCAPPRTIPIDGEKKLVIKRVKHYLETGEILHAFPTPPVSLAKPFTHYPLTPDTLILQGAYRADDPTRTLIRSLIGIHFNFTEFGQNWIETRWDFGSPPTYTEFAKAWQEEFELRRKLDYQSVSEDDQLYLNFAKSYTGTHPSALKREIDHVWEKTRADKSTKALEVLMTLPLIRSQPHIPPSTMLQSKHDSTTEPQSGSSAMSTPSIPHHLINPTTKVSIAQSAAGSAHPSKRKNEPEDDDEDEEAPHAKVSYTADPASGKLPRDLIDAIRLVYEPAGMRVTQTPSREAESAEYGACRLALNGQSVVFRIAKTTPTKIGQFVTLWKRVSGKTAPLDTTDDVAFVVVSVSDATHHGQFVFDRNTLITQGILSNAGKVGKMAFRLYAPWTKPIAKDAIKSQQWQVKYFLPISSHGTSDMAQVRKFFKFG